LPPSPVSLEALLEPIVQLLCRVQRGLLGYVHPPLLADREQQRIKPGCPEMSARSQGVVTSRSRNRFNVDRWVESKLSGELTAEI
jgi:hypothetical protein